MVKSRSNTPRCLLAMCLMRWHVRTSLPHCCSHCLCLPAVVNWLCTIWICVRVSFCSLVAIEWHMTRQRKSIRHGKCYADALAVWLVLWSLKGYGGLYGGSSGCRMSICKICIRRCKRSRHVYISIAIRFPVCALRTEVIFSSAVTNVISAKQGCEP